MDLPIKLSGQVPGELMLVEAAGQLFHLFRDGLDYAFIPAVPVHCLDAGRVIESMPMHLPNPSAGSFITIWQRISQSMSLYRANKVGLCLPLGVAMLLVEITIPLSNEGFTE